MEWSLDFFKWWYWPQWHSSHVLFPNNTKLEQLHQDALQWQQPLIIPKDLETQVYMRHGPTSPIKSNVIYMPELTNQVALDSFFFMNSLLYIFQFMMSEEHNVKPGLME